MAKVLLSCLGGLGRFASLQVRKQTDSLVRKIEDIVPFDVFKPRGPVGEGPSWGSWLFVFTESPDAAPHSNPVTALEKEGQMQPTGDRDACPGISTG